MGQARELFVINEVLFHRRQKFFVGGCRSLHRTRAILEEYRIICIFLGGHIKAHLVSGIIVFFLPIVGAGHGTRLHLILGIGANTISMNHGLHIQAILIHLVGINVKLTFVIHHTGIGCRTGMSIHVIPIGPIVINLADRTGEPAFLVTGVVIFGFTGSFNLYIFRMCGVIVFAVLCDVVGNLGRLAAFIHLGNIGITIVEGVNVVDGIRPKGSHGLGRY